MICPRHNFVKKTKKQFVKYQGMRNDDYTCIPKYLPAFRVPLLMYPNDWAPTGLHAFRPPVVPGGINTDGSKVICLYI